MSVALFIEGFADFFCHTVALQNGLGQSEIVSSGVIPVENPLNQKKLASKAISPLYY